MGVLVAGTAVDGGVEGIVVEPGSRVVEVDTVEDDPGRVVVVVVVVSGSGGRTGPAPG